jgi:hypothetical protein
VVSVPLHEFPFYRSRLSSAGEPAPWTLDDLAEFAATTGDPFGGRLRAGSRVSVALQVEASSEPPVWTALEPGELDAWAGGLARLWRRWGLVAGETIAFFDYGSSPCVLLASASYVAYLKRGAADRLGVTAVCNDGVASMAGRMATILETVRPAAIVLRRDLITPLVDALRTAGVDLAGRLRWAAVTEVEGAAAPAEMARLAETWGVPVRRTLRADAAFLLAGDCDACGLFHLDRRLFRAETLAAGAVAVTARFAAHCPAVRYNIGPAELARAGCTLEPAAARLAWR